MAGKLQIFVMGKFARNLITMMPHIMAREYYGEDKPKPHRLRAMRRCADTLYQRYGYTRSYKGNRVIYVRGKGSKEPDRDT